MSERIYNVDRTCSRHSVLTEWVLRVTRTDHIESFDSLLPLGLEFGVELRQGHETDFSCVVLRFLLKIVADSGF